jgi:L-threonylcarbamoyladenylate synthase
MGVVDEAVLAVRAGKPIVFPADTVYGLATTAFSSAAALRLYALKDRPPGMPSALMAADLDTLLALVPELHGRPSAVAETLLPGPFTLIFPNPARRFRWLTGDRPDTIGVRVCALPEPGRAVLARVGAVLATSANVHGQPDPRRVEDLADEIRAGLAAIVDAGELPGVRSTILDLTGAEPTVVREGAVPGVEAIERALAAIR